MYGAPPEPAEHEVHHQTAPAANGGHYNDDNYVDDALQLPDPDVLDPQLHATFGDRYAGSWIDRDVQPSGIRVAVVDATWLDDVALDSLTAGDPRVEVVPVDHSIVELTTIREKVEQRLMTSGNTFMIGLETQANRVIVKIPDASASVVDALLAGTGATPDDVEVDGGFQGVPLLDERG